MLPRLYSLHLYDWSGEVTIDDLTHRISPGTLSIIQPGARMVFRYRGPSVHLFAHLSLTPAESGPMIRLPYVADLGHASGDAQERLRVLRQPTHRSQQTAEVWSLFWGLPVVEEPKARPHTHPALSSVLAHVEAHLADHLRVEELAQVGCISPGHLRRVARASLGMPLSAYIQSRRRSRAEHLLRQSTLSIPAIAAAVGSADLHAFNKQAHRWWGCSPRTFRGSLKE